MKKIPVKNIYSKEHLEFMASVMAFVSSVEKTSQMEGTVFVDSMLETLPEIYGRMIRLRASLPHLEEWTSVEHFVTEDVYEDVRRSLLKLLGGQDAYVDVFMEEMRYSEHPVEQSISEKLSDIYQELKDFIWVCSQENEAAAEAAFCELAESFEIHWGQALVNVLRALHAVRYDVDRNG